MFKKLHGLLDNCDTLPPDGTLRESHQCPAVPVQFPEKVDTHLPKWVLVCLDSELAENEHAS